VNINSVSSQLPSFLQPLNTAANSVSSAQQTGTSTCASFLSELQQLQQQSPSEFTQIDSQIVSRLQQVAQQASSSGDSTQATQLNTLATQFQNANNGGPIPTAQQLQQAGLSGHHHSGFHGGGQRKDSQLESMLSTLQTPSTTSVTQNMLTTLLGSTSSPAAF